MTALVENLSSKSPFFIRCIKPNDTKSPVVIDTARVIHQVCLCFPTHPAISNDATVC